MRTGRVQDQVHVDQRTGRVQDQVNVDQRTGTVQDKVHVDQRTGTVQDQVHVDQRTGRVQDQVHVDQRTGTVQDQVHVDQRTGRVQDQVHVDQRRGTVQDQIHMEQRTGSRPEQSREGMVKSASAYADLQQHRSEGVHRKPSPVSSYVPQPDYLEDDEDSDLIKPKKLLNPVKASKSHQELHRELMRSCKRGGVSVEMKPELQRVLDSRKRDQLIKQRKQEEEAHRKISPLEAELIKRHKKLEELEKQQEKQQEENLKAPEFVKVKKNLRRTSFQSKEEKEV